ncbi:MULTISPECIES: hypothetical protein [unclassified Streptomyces]
MVAAHRTHAPESFTVHGDTQAAAVDLDPDYRDPSGDGAPHVVLAA